MVTVDRYSLGCHKILIIKYFIKHIDKVFFILIIGSVRQKQEARYENRELLQDT